MIITDTDTSYRKMFTFFKLITLIDWYWETSEAVRPTVNPSARVRPVKTFNAINQFDS